MPVNLTDAAIGQPLEEGISYTWRITAVAAVKSKAGNLRLDVSAAIADGPSVGQVAKFPAYAFMIYDAVHGRTAQWIDKTRSLIARIVGVEKRDITDIPSSEGDHSESMDLLLNAMFEAPAEWQPPQDGWDGRWYVGRVVRSVQAEEVVPPDWAAFFED